MKYLLDTSICIYIIKKHPPGVLQRFRRHESGEIGVSAVTASELAFGVAKSGSDRNMAALQKFLAPLEIAPYDEACAWHYGRLRAHLAQQGTPIGSLDQMIAAHALALDATLVTNNLREFERVPGLQLDNWVQDLPE